MSQNTIPCIKEIYQMINLYLYQKAKIVLGSPLLKFMSLLALLFGVRVAFAATGTDIFANTGVTGEVQGTLGQGSVIYWVISIVSLVVALIAGIFKKNWVAGIAGFVITETVLIILNYFLSQAPSGS